MTTKTSTVRYSTTELSEDQGIFGFQSESSIPLRKSGIEPEAIAWKAIILPLNYSRVQKRIALIN